MPTFKYTDNQRKELLASMVVLVDTREQRNENIIATLDEKKITYKTMKLDFGDYSVMLPKNPELSIPRDLYFTDDIFIERKMSLDELAQNFKGKSNHYEKAGPALKKVVEVFGDNAVLVEAKNERQRFENEMLRADAKGAKGFLMVEGGSFADMMAGNYRSEFDAGRLSASFFTFIQRYGLTVNFVSREYSGQYIIYTLYYFIKEILNNGFTGVRE